MRTETRLTRGLFTLGFAVLLAATTVQWGAAQGGIVTTDLTGALTPLDLVTALVGTTNAPTVSNVVFTGDKRSGGLFSGGTATVGFGSGIALGSGSIGSIAGPNDSASTSTSFGTPGDPALNALIPGLFTQDATILEFDFQCSTSQVVSFRYVFSSEEYNEFVDSEFNDVFGFFVNGKNIALLPQTTTPVAINNVNGIRGSQFFRSNEDGSLDIEPDGLTVVLGAEATINSGVNHIKLAIADASDTIYDSWVFLQQGSFQCGALRRTARDFDGDGKADITVFRPSNGTWYSLKSSTNFTGYAAYQWGVSTDVVVPGDYDGDGRADPTIYRPSTGVWYILKSSTNFTGYAAYQWGVSTDVAVPGDYDGDGRADPTIYRPSTGVWYILKSSTNFTGYAAYQWGVSTDVAVPGDYDGDGRADPTIYRPSTGVWYILKSSTNFTGYAAYQWGVSTDVAVPGDYDGDGRADPTIYRPSTGVWYILKSSTNFTGYAAYQWGVSTDVAVPGDYDGDGRADPTIYRPSTGVWYILKSSTNFTGYAAYQWGVSTDLPILNGL